MVLGLRGEDGTHQSGDASPVPGQIGPETYESWRRSRLGSIIETRELDLIFRMAGPIDGQRLLDAGCGDGIYLVEAARLRAQATGVDISEAMLRVARRRAADAGATIDLHRADLQQLPFADDTFDVVMAITVLCFVPDRQRAVDEMARVLMPGGRLVIGELGRWSTWAAWRRLRGWLGLKTWRQATFRFGRQLIDLVEHAGLDVEDVRGAIYYPPSSSAARLFSRFEHRMGRVTTMGAAFVAVSAVKPHTPSSRPTR